MTFTEKFDAHAYIVNGWDNNSENNDALSFGGRLGVKPVEMLAVGFSAFMGAEAEGKGPENRAVLDVDVTITPIDRLMLGGELNIGSEPAADSLNVAAEGDSASYKVEDAEWMGMLGIAHYDFNETFGLTGRFGMFSDAKGIRTGVLIDKDVTYTSLTLAPTVKLGEKMGCLLEVLKESANEKIWLDADGKATDARSTVAFEVTYGF